MNIFVDADACPNAIKEILYKAAKRKLCPLILVANRPLKVPSHRLIKTVTVSAGFDVADDYIVSQVIKNDIVITADIPLADGVIAKQAHALNPRGFLYTANNIKQKLSERNFMTELRSSGLHTGGPKTMTPKDVQQFANSLDRLLARITVNHSDAR